MLTYHKITEEEKYLIAEWKYEGDYAIYNMEPYEEQKKRGCGFANPKNNFYSFYDEEILIGFINLQERETEVFFGIGVNPDYCSEGYGQQIIQSACKLACRMFPEKLLYLEVRTWNIRAVRCYEKSGFHIEGEAFHRITPIGEGMFYRMIKEDKGVESMKDRIIRFEGIFNARDMGGLQTIQGDMISSRCLIRSANLSDATEMDKKILKEEYHIAKVIDLRTGMERSEKPDSALQEVEYLPIPIFDESIVGISHEKSLNKEQILSILPKMEHLYRQMITDESCRKRLGKAASCVMEHDFSKGSILWHCTEGKDRCGLLSAVLLSALGVERGVIIEDYMLTNNVNKAKAERYYQMLLSLGKTESEAGIIRDIFLAKESYLEAAFFAIDEQYENMETFLCEGLNIPGELVMKFRESVLR